MLNKFSLNERINIAYKKLKASNYFDKTQLPLRDKIVEFEAVDVEKKLHQIYTMLCSEDKTWDIYKNNILKSIGALIYPKKLVQGDKDNIIFNNDCQPAKLEKPQYFIDLPVIGHILSVLWVLSVGVILDNRNNPERILMYEHSYGNRLKKTLINSDSEEITYSPNLFEPYFSQYESWRDKALEDAKKRLDDKQDALILALDLKSFFYSIDIQENEFNELINIVDKVEPWHKRVHSFVYDVLREYSNIIRNVSIDKELTIGERTILPIGFLPSYILSNWILIPFDNEIIKRWNPVYYGRYVDDIIIVDKVEKNSPLRKIAQETHDVDTKLSTKQVIEYFFCSCPSDRIMPSSCDKAQKLFIEIPENEKKPSQKDLVYRINPAIFHNKNGAKPDIQIQNEKVKVFYFREGSTRALLDCFLSQIAKNASEFRHLPEMETILIKNDYSEIFRLSSDDSIHKLRGVTGVDIDKFSLSKFLGKYRKAGAMLRDKKETKFDKDLLTILNCRALIDNYILWERILEIMIVNDRLLSYEKLVINIIDSIVKFDIPKDKVNAESIKPHEALFRTLHAALCRTSALRWGSQMDKTIHKITDAAQKKLGGLPISTEISESYSEDMILFSRIYYCKSRMINKYILPIPIDCIYEDIFEQSDDICLFKLEDVIGHINDAWESEGYRFYPYMVTPQELSYAHACQNIGKASDLLLAPNMQMKKIELMYRAMNYPNLAGKMNENDLDKFALNSVKTEKFKQAFNHNELYAISVDNGSCDKLKVSIGNARLDQNDFYRALTGNPNRRFERYDQLSDLLHAAIIEKVDLLVLPENYLPWEWVPDVARLCANNQMGLITGIEHVISPKSDEKSGGKRKVYNLTAVILPYRQDDYKYAYITYHQKVHFSPEEKRVINGYRYDIGEGNAYHLFSWRDVWFSVYCCFELASIKGRAMFQSLADLTVAVEWNKDVTYFSNIIESLCRDLHCFCIQVNSSDYGDSRVISPSHTENRDLIKTKGGKNCVILVDEIDIHALREFQIKEYELQRQDDNFKPTPPDFIPSLVEHKQKRTLWKYMQENMFE